MLRLRQDCRVDRGQFLVRQIITVAILPILRLTCKVSAPYDRSDSLEQLGRPFLMGRNPRFAAFESLGHSCLARVWPSDLRERRGGLGAKTLSLSRI